MPAAVCDSEAGGPFAVQPYPVRRRSVRPRGYSILLAAAATFSLAPSLAAQGKVVRNRRFYDQELTVRPGEEWFGLFPRGAGWHLTSLRVRSLLRDTVCGPEFTVDFGVNREALFLVRGVSSLTPGVVRTLDTTRHMLLPGQSFGFSYGPSSYRLYATGSDSLRPRDYRLHLARSGDGRRQVLVANNVAPGIDGIAWPPRVEWIGDLDRDGRPDFLIDIHMYETPDHWALFLSSDAGPTQIVAMVADHAGWDC